MVAQVRRKFRIQALARRVGNYGSFRVRIRDARPIAGTLDLDRHGFALRRHDTAVRDFYDEREVRDGFLRCRACLSEFKVHRGVPELLYEPPQHILTEAAGLERFAEQMRLEGWDRERVRRLPDLEHGYWYVQARSMHQLLTTIPFQPGQSILDVGSNTCWASLGSSSMARVKSATACGYWWRAA